MEETKDELIYLIAERFGEMPDKVLGHVDEFERQGGNHFGLQAALDAVKERGYGYFRTLLRAEKYINMEEEDDGVNWEHVEWCRRRYEAAQASEADTAAKRLAGR